MKNVKTWIAAALALACGGAQPSKQGLHRDCSDGSACASGQLCLQYTGFAGQPLSSCEIPCDFDRDCPAPLSCVAVSDGPGQLTCN